MHEAAVDISESTFLLKRSDEERRISVLTNPIDYFLESAFIVQSRSSFRLIVMHNKRILVDETYRSARGSKIAFSRFYRDRMWKEGVKPRWSPFYNPDSEFIDDHCKRVKRVKKVPFH